MYNNIHLTDEFKVKSCYNGDQDHFEEGPEKHNASSQDTARHYIVQYPSNRDSAASHKDMRNCQTSSTFPLTIIIEEETSGCNDDLEDKGMPEIGVCIHKNIQI